MRLLVKQRWFFPRTELYNDVGLLSTLVRFDWKLNLRLLALRDNGVTTTENH